MFEVYYFDEDVWQEISIRKVLMRLSNTYIDLSLALHWMFDNGEIRTNFALYRFSEIK